MPYEKEIAAAKHQLDITGRTSGIKLLALGGSHAYGLATPDSDVDIRGFATPIARDVLLGDDFGQVQTMDGVDMCVYSLSKACKLMSQCNPNMIELLGLDDSSILVRSSEHDEMCAHPEWFLSRRAAHTFGGYATAQLRRIQNAMARDAHRLAEGEIRSLEAALVTLPERYPLLDGNVTISFDTLDTDGDDVRIMVTMSTRRVPATELASFARQLDSARKSAETIGKNRRKESRKLAKHASHLIRLLHMGTEILRGDGVHTRRDEDADLLLDIKRGMWLSEDENGRRTYDDAFWDLLSESEREFAYAKDNTVLPDTPQLNELHDFIADCHRRIICA